MIKPQDNEDKLAWCQYGEETELEFVKHDFTGGIDIQMNPAKTHDKYTHDMQITMPCDLKTIRTRFRKASDLYGIDSVTAVTINKKDIERYKLLYPHIIVVLDIEYKDIEFPDYVSIRYAPLMQLVSLIKSKKAKLHSYENRKNDFSGNARDSYVFDSKWFGEIQKK